MSMLTERSLIIIVVLFQILLLTQFFVYINTKTERCEGELFV